ncbi:MAG: hypothetical protein CMF46_04655 [Legionellales bacterium]|nr:hypothetical protein [Legionellales bacterium]|tara:strand:- start:1061 stop:1579 length:519 start_codon:yes stop_codon:yes gene_type:complete
MVKPDYLENHPSFLTALRSGQTKIVVEQLKLNQRLITLTDTLHGYNVLHIAAKSGCTQTVEKLYELDSNLISQKDYFGSYPIHLAITFGRKDTVVQMAKLDNIIIYQSNISGQNLKLEIDDDIISQALSSLVKGMDDETMLTMNDLVDNYVEIKDNQAKSRSNRWPCYLKNR